MIEESLLTLRLISRYYDSTQKFDTRGTMHLRTHSIIMTLKSIQSICRMRPSKGLEVNYKNTKFRKRRTEAH